MLIEKKAIFMLCLIFLETSCSSSCQKISYNFCPVYPVAGEKVEAELKNIPYDNYSNFWEWLGRINKLRLELELCNE